MERGLPDTANAKSLPVCREGFFLFYVTVRLFRERAVAGGASAAAASLGAFGRRFAAAVVGAVKAGAFEHEAALGADDALVRLLAAFGAGGQGVIGHALKDLFFKSATVAAIMIGWHILFLRWESILCMLFWQLRVSRTLQCWTQYITIFNFKKKFHR
jgi:hypothetical protein